MIDPEFQTEGYIPEEGEIWPYSGYLTAEAGGCCDFGGNTFTSGPDAKVGVYTNKVTLCDSLENCETFTMSFEVKPIPVEPVIEEEVVVVEEEEEEEVVVPTGPPPEPLTVAYSGISKRGVISIKFSQNMDPPDDWAEILNPVSDEEEESEGEEDEEEDDGEEEERRRRRRRSLQQSEYSQQLLDLFVQKGEGSDPADLTFRWEIEKYEGKEMSIQVYFDKADYISASGAPDTMVVVFKTGIDPPFWVDERGETFKQEFRLERGLVSQF